MTPQKFTIIEGYDVNAINPYGRLALGRPPRGDEIVKCLDWQDEHHRVVVRVGHWHPASCFAEARKRGWSRVLVSHRTTGPLI